MLVETLYSLISTGTELACLSGGESWFQMPAVPGYCCVSKVLEAGEDAPYKEGDLIFHYGMHSRYQLTSPDSYNLVVKVPEGLDLQSIPMVRMATIAFTSIRAFSSGSRKRKCFGGQNRTLPLPAQLPALSRSS